MVPTAYLKDHINITNHTTATLTARTFTAVHTTKHKQKIISKVPKKNEWLLSNVQQEKVENITSNF